MTVTTKAVSSTVLRPPVKEDGYAIHQLIRQCPPLDLNSVYTYLLLSEHFAQTCIVAETEEWLDGCVSAYMPPGKSDVLFVWQVAVHRRARGRGLGQHMLRQLLARPELHCVRYLDTTVGPDNAASRSMFYGLAEYLDAPVQERALFESRLFGPEGHDDECLIRIGPITSANIKEH